MPRFYRNQFAPWQPDKQVFQVLPSDLSTINSLVIVTHSTATKAAQSSVEAYATERVNMALWFMCNGGIK
jgi:ABC-type glycerol-3-phosphate transport system permease component